MKRTCLDCNGKGEVDVIGYREPQQPSSKTDDESNDITYAAKTSKIDWKKIRTKINKYTTTFLLVVGASVIISSCMIGMNCFEMDSGIRQWNASIDKFRAGFSGVVIAQYGSDGKVQRCWVKQKSDSINVVGNVATVQVPNRFDIIGFAHSIGIEHPEDCLR